MTNMQKEQHLKVNIINNLKSIFTEIEIAEFFIEEWECMDNIDLAKVLIDKLQTEGKHSEVDHHEITDSVINEVFQCRLIVLAMKTDSSDPLLRSLSHIERDPYRIINVQHILDLLNELKTPDRFFDYMEWLLEIYKSDVNRYRGEYDIIGLQEARNYIENALTNFSMEEI